MFAALDCEYGAASQTGPLRAENQDRVFADPELGVYLVVDGLGGHPYGAKASDVACAVIQAELQLSANARTTTEARVRTAITVANNVICHLSEHDPDSGGMRCVLTLALVRDGKVTVGHVGDSRLYVIGQDSMRKVTSDHSPVGERQDAGDLTEADAMLHPRRNEVSRCLGSTPHQPGDAAFIEITQFRFRPDTALLVCSDGLTSALTSERIFEIARSHGGDPEATAGALLREAREAGAVDDVSTLFVAGPHFSSPSSVLAPRARAVKLLRNKWTGIALGLIAGILLWTTFQHTATRLLASGHNRVASHYVIGPDQSIAKTMAQAQSGDTIELLPGQYHASIQLKEGVKLMGRTAGQAILWAPSGGVGITAHGIKSGRIEGLRITGDAAHPALNGIQLSDSNVDVYGNDISNAVDAGISIIGTSKGVLQANYIHDQQGYGVLVGAQAEPRILGNRIINNGRNPAAPKPGLLIISNLPLDIAHNIVQNNGAAGFGDSAPDARVKP